MSIDIEKVQEAICILNFKRTDLLEIALTHPSRIYENYNNRQQQDKQECDYRRLAILGDTILGTTIIDYLYQKYPDFNQQKITDIKSQIVSRKTCYKFAKKLNLKDLCVLGGSERLKEENKQIELLAEMFEALFGAIYLHYDRNFSLASDWLIKHFIKDAVDEFLKSNQISEELPVDYSKTISSMNVDESSKLLWEMKEEADTLVAQDDKLQTLLSWIHKKSSLVDTSYKHTEVRAFYLALIRIFGLGFVRNCDPTVNSNSKVRNFFDSFNRVNALGLELSFKFNSKFDPANVLASILIVDIEPELKLALQQLKIELPNPKTEQVRFEEWRQEYGQNWLDRIKQLIGYDLVLSEHQKELLKKYYEKNLLIIKCLNESKLAPELKQDIEETLFLPTQSDNT
ncbi:NACHT C-terminal helical domain 2-containing protein [Nostoc sp.]|uniref:NACHT C-terminal helical domain 2-containing protein n=1 Tax=Nostoc sp. TaxID=1180 RepID=UPI002FF4C4A9